MSPVLTGVQAVQLENIARDCERAGPSESYYLWKAGRELCRLGLISEADTTSFHKCHDTGARVDATKLLMPPGFHVAVRQTRDGWQANATGPEKETVKGKAVTEHHARTAAALRAWGKVTV